MKFLKRFLIVITCAAVGIVALFVLFPTVYEVDEKSGACLSANRSAEIRLRPLHGDALQFRHCGDPIIEELSPDAWRVWSSYQIGKYGPQQPFYAFMRKDDGRGWYVVSLELDPK